MKKAFVFKSKNSARGIQVALNDKSVDIDFYPAPSNIGLKLAGKIGHAVALIDAGQPIKTYSGKTIASREALAQKLASIRMQCSTMTEFTLAVNSTLIYCDSEEGAATVRVTTQSSADFSTSHPISEVGAPFRRGPGRPRVIKQSGSHVDILFSKNDRLRLTVGRDGRLAEAGKIFTRKRKPLQADPLELKDIKIGSGREDAVESLAKIRRSAPTLADFINKTIATFKSAPEAVSMA